MASSTAAPAARLGREVLCAYCEAPCRATCRACGRPTCPRHALPLAGYLCLECAED